MTYSAELNSDQPGYGFDSDKNKELGYKSPPPEQGNFSNGYQENVYDNSNLGDNAYTDSAAQANPQLEM